MNNINYKIIYKLYIETDYYVNDTRNGNNIQVVHDLPMENKNSFSLLKEQNFIQLLKA